MKRYVLFLSTVFSLAALWAQEASLLHSAAFLPAYRDSLKGGVINEERIETENWATLPQVQFWRQAMNLSPDSSFFSLAKTRQILHTFPTEAYDTLERAAKNIFKDSLRATFGLEKDAKIYVTYGKADFYDFKSVLPDVRRGIPIFEEVGVPGWYAQSILLIESPGRLRQSPNGAYGPFQLMRSIAIDEGLTVNSKVDEREDFEKSATASASFIKRVCIPETKAMLRSRGIAFQTDELWFRLLVLHVYHAGSGNVRGALRQIPLRKGGMPMIQKLWQTKYRGFGNASQNYSQVALASNLELQAILNREP